ncbi:hypothetical protein ASE99_23425 [Serratia sp. Leaf51]|nr:hypothetical protein ASE99_23425 [Serratia sp. Leaf51]
MLLEGVDGMDDDAEDVQVVRINKHRRVGRVHGLQAQHWLRAEPFHGELTVDGGNHDVAVAGLGKPAWQVSANSGSCSRELVSGEMISAFIVALIVLYGYGSSPIMVGDTVLITL